jgi:hypothetical protein
VAKVAERSQVADDGKIPEVPRQLALECCPLLANWFMPLSATEAIALARSMGAKAWELRATASLARLLAKYGRRDEGHAMLAEIYAWFTEGFDTADLKDTKALLDE